MSSTTSLRTQWRAVLVCLAALAFPLHALAEPDGQSALGVEGSAFVLRTPDGRVLRGIELAGATFTLGLADGRAFRVRLDSITADAGDPDLLRHDYRVLDADGGWQPICGPNAQGERWGFPIVLPEGHPGREGEITLTCVSGAVGKCVRSGYKPWQQGPDGESLLPYHAACVRMVRADYCGDGETHTKDGTLIDVYDRAGIQEPDTREDPDSSFEAGWGPDGATCIAHTRWADMITPQALGARCPRLVQNEPCTEARARGQGALLFNRSRPAAVEAGVPRIPGTPSRASDG